MQKSTGFAHVEAPMDANKTSEFGMFLSPFGVGQSPIHSLHNTSSSFMPVEHSAGHVNMDPRLLRRIEAEQKVKAQLDRTFFSTKTIMRRDPDRYIRNPTKVLATTISDSTYALYEAPGQQSYISKNRLPKQSSPLRVRRSLRTVEPDPKLRSLLMPEAPKLVSKEQQHPKGGYDPSIMSCGI